jgi:hypothetical protein
LALAVRLAVEAELTVPETEIVTVGAIPTRLLTTTRRETPLVAVGELPTIEEDTTV